MLVYHVTAKVSADAIEAEGFVDGEGTYLTQHVRRGVWLSDDVLDISEGAWGDTVLELEIPENIVAQYEWIEEDKGFREFLVPADVVNRFGIKRRYEHPLGGCEKPEWAR